MADVILCYAREDGAVAGRLGAAVAGLGYSLWSEEDLAAGGSADITDRISGAKAAIVVWSPAAAASEWVRAEANFARGQNKLIQASADGGPPPLPFRQADVAAIGDWRGDEGHPGWRRIRAGLEALCGPPAAHRPARPAASPPVAAAAAARRRGGGLLVAITLALFAAVALATFVWMRDLMPTAPQQRAVPVAAAPVPAAPLPAPPLDAAVTEPEPASEPAPAEPSAGSVEAPPPRPRPSGPRIVRDNAENMRLFCERAGQGTPECLTFARRLRDQRR